MAEFDLDIYEDWKDDDEDRSIKKILSAAVTSSEPTAMEEAAQSLDATTTQFPGTFPGSLATIEDVLIFAASIFPYDGSCQPALIQLISALRRLPEREGVKTGWQWKALFEGELPGVLHEAFNGGLEIRAGVRYGRYDETVAKKRWRNYNSFEARLLKEGLTDCSLHALWAFCDALEVTSFRREPADLCINVAIDWLDITGEKLFGCHAEWGAASRGGSLWKGSHGFSAGRWALWARRLHELSLDEAFDSGLRARMGLASKRIEAASITDP